MDAQELAKLKVVHAEYWLPIANHWKFIAEVETDNRPDYAKNNLIAEKSFVETLTAQGLL